MDHYQVQCKLALLEKEFKTAESILLEQGLVEDAMTMYRNLHKWDQALAVARAKVCVCPAVAICVGERDVLDLLLPFTLSPAPSRPGGPGGGLPEVADGHLSGGEGRGAEGTQQGLLKCCELVHEGGPTS